MKSFLIKTTFFVLLLAFLGCDASKKVPTKSDCKTIGMVKDYTGLDGCRLMIETEDGRKLLPAKINQEGFVLKDGQKIAFDFVEAKDYGMTVCMAEDMIIEITCIQKLAVSKEDVKDKCVDTFKPEEVEWLKKLIEETKPIRILKYPRSEEEIFYMLYAKPNSIVYDCKGNKVCEVPNGEKNDCYNTMQALGRGQMIYLDKNGMK